MLDNERRLILSEWISESLLEMHFHRALVDYFSNLYGAKFLKILKPTPQKEAWVGFDQGWTKSDLTNEELFNELRQTIKANNKQIHKFYIGYFLQFKIVELINRRSRNIPPNYITPYYRSKLSLNPNKITGISQHETLLRLNRIKNTIVYYACPMLFDQDELYDHPDINKLRLVDINSAPSGWATNQSHFVAFQTTIDQNPYWCSEPIGGKSFTLKEMAREEKIIRKLSGQEIIGLLNKAVMTIKGLNQEHLTRYSFKKADIKYLPECFTIVEYEQ